MTGSFSKIESAVAGPDEWPLMRQRRCATRRDDRDKCRPGRARRRSRSTGSLEQRQFVTRDGETREMALGLADVPPEGFGCVARRHPDPVVTPVWSMNCPDGAVGHSQELFQRADDHGASRSRVSSRPHHGIERPRHFLLQVGKPGPSVAGQAGLVDIAYA